MVNLFPLAIIGGFKKKSITEDIIYGICLRLFFLARV